MPNDHDMSSPGSGGDTLASTTRPAEPAPTEPLAPRPAEPDVTEPLAPDVTEPLAPQRPYDVEFDDLGADFEDDFDEDLGFVAASSRNPGRRAAGDHDHIDWGTTGDLHGRAWIVDVLLVAAVIFGLVAAKFLFTIVAFFI